MAERPFPPSPRRRALARQSGLHAASPFVVAAAAAAGLLLALAAAGPGLAHALGESITAAIRSAGTATTTAATAGTTTTAAATAGATTTAGTSPAFTDIATTAVLALPRMLLAVALPLLGAAALAAALAHLAQTRAAWLPRRKLRGAPAPDAGPIPRTRRAAGQLAAALVVVAVAFGWLWRAAPQLATLPALAPATQLAAVAALLLALATAVAVAWIALGALDAVARHAAVDRALRMTSSEKREDDRLAGADPRWQARRAQLARQVSPDEAVAGASFLLLGDDLAIAVAWDPARRPVPTRTAAARGPRATQLLGLARRRHLPIHRDPALAAALVEQGLDAGPIPDRHWPRLAEIVAAIHGRDRQTL